MKKYEIQLDDFGNPCAITIEGENISIPMDIANSDYQRYLRWLNGEDENQLS